MRILCLMLMSGFLALPSITLAEEIRHVVLISVDGLAASYFDDPKADLPTLRAMAREGVRAKGMLTTFPSVTWPSHTSLVTGTSAKRHGVLGNSVFDRRAGRELIYIGDPELEKDQAVRVPTLYDAASAKGLTSGSVIWPACNAARSLKWVIPDSSKPALHARYTTPGFVDELKAAGIDISELGAWGWGKQYSSQRDDLYTRVAIHLLEKHQANLVLLHLITPDGVEHAFGPHTPEAYKAVAEADANVKRIRETLQKPPFAGHSALFVVSDHGFAPIRKLVRPNVALRALGLIDLDANNKPAARRAWCVAQGGSAFIYLLDEAARGAEKQKEIKAALAKLEGVERVIEPSEFEALGLPLPDDNPESPHLILATGQGYSFNNDVAGDAVGPATETYRGTHGHLPQPDWMHATFVAEGSGIRRGVTLPVISNTDVAPTIAQLMGLSLPSAEGKVLNAILSE